MVITGDIIYKEVAAMNHGRRPCVVIGITGDWAHIVPLSTSDWNGQPYIQSVSTEAGGYAAPNRYHKAKVADLEAEGWVSEEDAGIIWDLIWG